MIFNTLTLKSGYELFVSFFANAIFIHLFGSFVHGVGGVLSVDL